MLELQCALLTKELSCGWVRRQSLPVLNPKRTDVETGLDYFGASYYASTQGRFTGVDPYDINLERQNTPDPEEANALFRNYISQPQHWNRYAYALNTPLRYVDPDDLMSYEAELLGKQSTVHIDDSLLKKDPGALKRL